MISMLKRQRHQPFARPPAPLRCAAFGRQFNTLLTLTRHLLNSQSLEAKADAVSMLVSPDGSAG